MAPNVTVGFWAANDINGTPLLLIDDEDSFFRKLKLKPDLYGLGGWELELSRKVGFAILSSGAFQPETFVRFMVHAYSDTEWYWGGVLNKRLQTVVHREEDGEEVYRVGGTGPKQYTDRYRLGTEETGSGSGFVNLKNGVWVWREDATAGQILNRVINNDADADPVSLPDLTKSFTASLDSDGVAWAEGIAEAGGSFQIPIGTSLLQLIWDLEDLGELYTTVNLGTLASPTYELEAWQSYGTDASGGTPALGVCVLREGLNIANDSMEVSGVAIRKFSHVLVEGKDGAWATAVRSSWTPGEYVKWGIIDYKRSSNVNILERAGLRFLRRQDNGDKEIDVEIVPGASEADGYYFPKPGGVLWLGNTITLDTGVGSSTPLDYQNEDQLVTGLEIELGPAGDTSTADRKAKSWDVTVLLNHERGGNPQSPDQSSAASAGRSSSGRDLCVDRDVLRDLDVAAIKVSGEMSTAPRENAVDGDDLSTWGSAEGEPLIGVAGEWWAGDLSQSETIAEYRIRQVGGDPSSAHLDNVATEVRIYVSDDAAAWGWLPASGKIASDPIDHGWSLAATYAGALAFVDTGRVDFDPTGGRYVLFYAVSGGTMDWDVSTFELWTHSGISGQAAPCDHPHRHIDLLDRDRPAQHLATAIEYDGSTSGLSAADIQAAIDEIAATPPGSGNLTAPSAVNVDLGATQLLTRRAATNTEDDLFNAASLDAKWLGGAADLTLIPGWAKVTALAYQPIPAGDWTIETEVMLEDITAVGFESVGLRLVDSTSGRYAELAIGQNNSLTAYRVFYERHVPPSTFTSIVSVAIEPINYGFLRIVKSGTTYHGEFSRNGRTWMRLGSVTAATIGATPNRMYLTTGWHNGFYRY